MQDILERLALVIESRKTADPGSSYTATLMHAGVDAMNKKVIEEAYETCVAARCEDKEHLVREIADLFYHVLVLAASREVHVAEIAAELERRSGVSGLQEKAARR
jgi:phosphoribosyl-ATP pyrophosphohydrolase